MNTLLRPHCCACVPIDWELISPDFLKINPGTVRVTLINPSVMGVAIQKNDSNTALSVSTHCPGDLYQKHIYGIIKLLFKKRKKKENTLILE